MPETSAIACPSCRAPLAGDARFCGRCGTTIGAAPITLDTLPGNVVGGRYRVLSKLGAGGMGTVFRAEQVSVKRVIALKVLDPAITTNPELTRRFQAEAEVVARLSHPNTVTLFDFGRDDSGLLFIAMELVTGASLRDAIAREAPLVPYRAVDIAEQIASSLADAHAHGIVHRDLKPDNVILSERAGRKDFARVLDFGIAKLFADPSGAPAMTRAGQILGTPQYMAPEQVIGAAIDGRTDVYALGVMLYEMLTGAPPFTGDNLIALLSKHVHDAPPPLQAMRPGVVVPMPLERLVMACLAKEQAARPPDMRTVAAELLDLRSLLDPGPRRSSAVGVPGTMAALTPPPIYTPPPVAMATPSPPVVAMPPLPTPGPMAPPPPLAPAPVRRSRAPMAVGALLLLGGAGAAIAYVATRDTPGATVPGDDVAQAGSKPLDIPAGTAETFRSSRLGFALELPVGVTAHEDPPSGGMLAQGSYDGNPISIAVAAVAGDADVDSRVAQVTQATAGAAQMVERRARKIRGQDLVSLVYDVPSAGSRFESVFYPSTPPLAVTFAAAAGAFDDTAALRDSLFKDRFAPPN